MFGNLRPVFFCICVSVFFRLVFIPLMYCALARCQEGRITVPQHFWGVVTIPKRLGEEKSPSFVMYIIER